VDAVLKPGDVTEKIEIVAESIALETTQPELGALIETKVLEELPNQINSLGRQIDNFLTLTPGVTATASATGFNGGLDFQNEVVFNGVVANQSEPRVSRRSSPALRIVSEFRVLTSVFSAQYGLAQGVASYQFAFRNEHAAWGRLRDPAATVTSMRRTLPPRPRPTDFRRPRK